MDQPQVMIVSSVVNHSLSMLNKLKEDIHITPELEERIKEIMTAAYKAGHEFANVMGPAEEWSNNACLGYVIAGVSKLEYKDKEIQDIVGAVRGEFDWISIVEANQLYNKSPF